MLLRKVNSMAEFIQRLAQPIRVVKQRELNTSSLTLKLAPHLLLLCTQGPNLLPFLLLQRDWSSRGTRVQLPLAGQAGYFQIPWHWALWMRKIKDKYPMVPINAIHWMEKDQTVYAEVKDCMIQGNRVMVAQSNPNSRYEHQVFLFQKGLKSRH